MTLYNIILIQSIAIVIIIIIIIIITVIIIIIVITIIIIIYVRNLRIELTQFDCILCFFTIYYHPELRGIVGARLEA